MRNFLCITIAFIYCNSALAQLTRFEKSKGLETATYEETIAFYKTLAGKSKLIAVQHKGATDAGYPLPIVLVNADGTHNPAQWRRENKIIIFINNGIHPGEPDGIDASMMLVRDIVTGKVNLPQNIALAFIPIYNIGGSLNRNSTTRVNQNGPTEYGFRGNAQNLDLNRDFTKSDSKNAKSFAQIFHWLQPDLFIDNHVSDGADYQHTMTLITTQYEKLGHISGNYLRNIFEPKIYSAMKQKNWDIIPYVEFDGANFDKGITMFNETPRYSSGYAALFGTLSFIPETHMLKPYKERVQSTYDLLKSFIEVASSEQKHIKTIRQQATYERMKQDSFALKFVPDYSKNSEITFKGYQQDSTLSYATGLQKMFYNRNKPYSRQVKFYNYFKSQNFVKKPKAYVIPSGWYEVIERLSLNGVKMQSLQNDSVIKVQVYHIADYKSYPKPYEKHHINYATEITKTTDSLRFQKGDKIIYLNQVANRYLIEMLEPTGDDSFFAWNFFDAILQQKEGYSDYRWEDIAAEVLKKEPELQTALNKKKQEDPAFSSNSGAILRYIYIHSPYYEKAHLRYPVYRVE